MYCRYCGKELFEGRPFCGYCGKRDIGFVPLVEQQVLPVENSVEAMNIESSVVTNRCVSRAAYSASINEFCADVDSNEFIGKLCEGVSLQHIGSSISEKKSWESNAYRLKSLISMAKLPEDVQIVFEYKNPINGRIDCMLFGIGSDNKKHVIHIELKQWSNNSVTQLYDTGVFEVTAYVGGRYRILPHPSQQAFNYHQSLLNYIGAVNEPMTELTGYAYCYNYNRNGKPADLFAEQYEPIMKECPLHAGDQVNDFAFSLNRLLSSGNGETVFNEFVSSPIKPTPNLINAAANMLKGQQEFVLLDDQLASSNTIFGMVEKAIKNPGTKMALIVKGGPGTGKTVIALHVIAELASRYGNLTSFFTTRSKALRETLKDKLKKVTTPSGTDASGLIRYIYDFKPSHFSEGEVDVLLIDEAHRIQKSSNFMTDKKNEQTYLSQVMSLLYCSKVCVFFIDDNQGIKPDEIGLSYKIIEAAENYADRIKAETEEFVVELNKNKAKLRDVMADIEKLKIARMSIDEKEFEKRLNKLKKREDKLQELVNKEYQLNDVNSIVNRVEVRQIELKSQFRCNGSDNFLDWLDAVLYEDEDYVKSNRISFSDEYLLNVCDSPRELEIQIRALNGPKECPGQIARIVAGYCWDWSDKLQDNGDLYHDVKIGDWEMPWETNTVRARSPYDRQYAPSADLWASHPMGINQVGCVFSAQGFEVDYVGVIMGPDIAFDKNTRRIVTVKGYTHSVNDSAELFDTYIRNIYRVLLSRGRKGCFVYCCDANLSDYLKSLI